MNYKKYRNAEQWKDLGLIGETLGFTDDPIITAQGIGHSMYITKRSCPMDAAVVYSLLSLGQGEDVTAQQLVNNYTRTAYFFEEGLVADGYVTVDENAELYRCSFDKNIRLEFSQGSYQNAEHAPKIDPTKFTEFIQAVIEKEDSAMLSALLNAYNWEQEHCQAVFNTIPIDYSEFASITNVGFRELTNMEDTSSISWTKIMPLVLDALPDGVELLSTNGYKTLCAGTDVRGHCATHKPNTSNYERAWVYKNGLPQLYENEIISTYYTNSPQLHKHQCGDTIRFSEGKRNLINSVDDKLVIRCINKSLTRMINSRRVIKTSHGRGRTFQWKGWGWLEEIRSSILASNSMKRKLGDEVNGWVYSKGHVKQSHGMEIVTYAWEPKEAVSIYKVKVNTYEKGYGLTANIRSIALPYIFLSKSLALSFAETVTFPVPTESLPLYQTVDDDFNVTVKHAYAEVKEIKQGFSVQGTAMIEEYDTPLAMYRLMQTCPMEQFHILNEGLYNKVNRQTITKMI